MIKYTDEKLLELVPVSKSLSDLIRKLEIPTAGNYYAIFRYRLVTLGVDTSHWRHSLDKHVNKPCDLVREKKSVKSRLIHIKGNKCESCLNEYWLNIPICLEVHHVDGDPSNNQIENLQLLCPNCHSQTPNWRGRNNKTITPKYCSCGLEIGQKSIQCRSCSMAHRDPKRKFEISKEDLEKLIQEMPMTKIGKLLGVSDNAVKRRAEKLGIDLENKQGYWTKKKYNKL